MNLAAIREQALFQAGYTEDDLPEQLSHLNRYINEAYDLMALALYGCHVEEAGQYPPLSHDKSQPAVPEWAVRSLADYASWMLCRNGSAQRQSSGYLFRRAFDEALSRARQKDGKRFTHIPK